MNASRSKPEVLPPRAPSFTCRLDSPLKISATEESNGIASKLFKPAKFLRTQGRSSSPCFPYSDQCLPQWNMVEESFPLGAIPERLKCAQCTSLAREAWKLACCDQIVCGACKDNDLASIISSLITQAMRSCLRMRAQFVHSHLSRKTNAYLRQV